MKLLCNDHKSSSADLEYLQKTKMFSIGGQFSKSLGGQILAPLDRDELPSETRGELAGYAVAKLGTDLVAPGAIAKVASKSVNSAKELAAICKNLQIAQDSLILETALKMGNTTKIAEVIETCQKTMTAGEELGFTAREMGALKEAGKLEIAVSNACEHLTPAAKQSFDLFDQAQKFLKPYKEFMSESKARMLIESTGIRTFPRPSGIPENFRIQISEKGAGIVYMHPNHNHTSIRVMPGKPHSPLQHQQKPYVIYIKDGKALDKFGNKLLNKAIPAAHVPYEEFIYRN